MKRILVFGVVGVCLFVLTAVSLASENTPNEPVITQGETTENIDSLEFQCVVEETKEPIELAKRGCCSHHGGVCGCDESNDRIVCCDGTYSPSCRCSTY